VGGQVLEFLHRRVGDRAELFGFDVIDIAPAVEQLTSADPLIDWNSRIVRVGPTGRWPFDDGAIDGVISHHVLEHVHDLDAFMVEHHRVLRPGGAGVHVFPTSRLLIEPHLDIPFAHWPHSDSGRARVLDAARKFRVGSRGWRDQGVPAQLDYLRQSTRFRTYGQVMRSGRAVGLQVVAGPTLRYGVELMRAVCGRSTAWDQNVAYQRRPRSWTRIGLRGRTSSAVGQWLLPVTLFMRRPPRLP
jgi:SAM-dependent methyltransferase